MSYPLGKPRKYPVELYGQTVSLRYACDTLGLDYKSARRRFLAGEQWDVKQSVTREVSPDMTITPQVLAAAGTESALQSAYFCALTSYFGSHPETRWIFAIPNGGDRGSSFAGMKMKSEGVRKGVHDICVPVARGGFFGCYLEFKVPKKRGHKDGGMSPEQVEFGQFVTAQGYTYVVVYGWEEALSMTLKYLNLPRTIAQNI